MLFDSGATHSFIAPLLAKNVDRQASRLEIPLVVATPLGKSLEVGTIFRGCDVTIEDRAMPADLILLEMMEFDAILGMDWLATFHASLDC